VTLKRSKPEPVLWPCDIGQQIPGFDKCQLTVIWMSNIKDVLCKPWLCALVDLLARVWPP